MSITFKTKQLVVWGQHAVDVPDSISRATSHLGDIVLHRQSRVGDLESVYAKVMHVHQLNAGETRQFVECVLDLHNVQDCDLRGIVVRDGYEPSAGQVGVG